jgi:hypothetical protein
MSQNLNSATAYAITEAIESTGLELCEIDMGFCTPIRGAILLARRWSNLADLAGAGFNVVCELGAFLRA